jgi:hypothetical protein
MNARPRLLHPTPVAHDQTSGRCWKEIALAEQEDIEGVEFEYDVSPETTLDLDAEWVAWLESEPVPENVEGVDPSLIIGGGDDDVALA